MFKRIIYITLAWLIIGYIAFFSVQLLRHYYSFGSRAMDLGNFNQAIWNTSRGRLFHQTNLPGATNRLSAHVEMILVPISLLYHIYSGPEILFLLQSVVVGLGAVPVFALARFRLGRDWLALIFAAAYLLYPPIQGASLLDFHPGALAPTFLLSAFYFMERDRPRWFGLFAVLAAACKEDISLLVLMMGLYALLINRQYRLGLLTVGLSALWAGLAVFVIPPIFADSENIHWNRYDHLGDGAFNMVLNLFLRPHLFLGHLQQVEALTYIRLLLTPTAFTALFNPATLLLALPSLGINLLSSFPPMQRVNSLVYAAPIVPAIFISSIYGVANLRRFGRWLHRRYAPRPIPQTGRLFHLVIGGLILAASLLYHAQYGYLPGGGQYRGWEEITAHHRRAEAVFAQIPPDASLSAHDRLNPHVAERETVYIFDRGVEAVDYILLDVTEDSWPLHPVELRHRVDGFLAGEFGLVEAVDGYLLLKRDPTGSLERTLPDPFFDFGRVDEPEQFRPAFPASVTFDNKLQLIGYDLTLGAHEHFLPVIVLYWRAIQPLEQDYRLWPFVLDREGHLIEDTAERPLVATLWYPTSRWQPDEIIITRTLPRDLGREFLIGVGVATENWADPVHRLPITASDERLYTLENDTWARLGAFQKEGRRSYRAITPPPTEPSQPRQLEFWDQIRLQGVDLPAEPLRAGERLTFTLYWQTESRLPIDLTTFVHLLNEQGEMAAQLDWTPQDRVGYLPTTAWQPHRTVVDSQAIHLPPDLPPGQYRLVVGWYYALTGERLPVTGGEPPQLGVVTIE